MQINVSITLAADDKPGDPAEIAEKVLAAIGDGESDYCTVYITPLPEQASAGTPSAIPPPPPLPE